MFNQIFAGECKVVKDSAMHDAYTGRDIYDGLQWVTHELIYHYDGDGRDYFDEHYVDKNLSKRPYAYDITLIEEKNEIATLTFTVTKDNPYYGKFAIKRTKIGVTDVNDTLFFGYVSEIALNFDGSKTIMAKSILGLLEESEVTLRPKSHYLTDMTDDIIANGAPILYTAISNIESPSGDSALGVPTFNYGKVTMLLGKKVDLSDSGTVIGTRWNIIQTYLTDEYDGYLQLRYETNGEAVLFFVIDYLLEPPSTNNQEVRYGLNMLNLTLTQILPTNLVNCVRTNKLVSSSKGWWIFKQVSTDFVGGAAEDSASVKKFGYHTKWLVTDDGNTEAELNKLCKEELNKYPHDIEPELDVEAIDLADVGGYQVGRLELLGKTHVISEPHGIDGWYVCTKVVNTIDQPDRKEFHFGFAPKKLSDQQKATEKKAKEGKLSLRGVLAHLNG